MCMQIGLFCKAQVQTSAGIFLELLRIRIFAAPVALIIRNLLAATDNDFDDLDFDADLGSIEIEQLRDLDSSAHIPYLPKLILQTLQLQFNQDHCRNGDAAAAINRIASHSMR